MHKQKYKQKQKHEHKHTSKAKSGGDGGEKGFSALAWLDGGMMDEVAAEVTAAGATAEDAVPGKTRAVEQARCDLEPVPRTRTHSASKVGGSRAAVAHSPGSDHGCVRGGEMQRCRSTTAVSRERMRPRNATDRANGRERRAPLAP